MSGLKTSDIVAQLMAIERQPLVALQKQKLAEQDRSSAWSEIKSVYASLQSAAQQLTLRSTINARSASTDTLAGSPTILTASANADAAYGSFKVLVSQLATQTVATSSAAMGKVVDQTALLPSNGFTTPLTSGTFTVSAADSAGGTIKSATVTIDTTTDVLNNPADPTHSIVDKIQAAYNSLTAAGLTTTFTVSLATDSAGRAQNALKITPSSATAKLYFGTGADTSNFLSAASLTGAQQAVGDGSVTSIRPLAGTDISAAIGSATSWLPAPVLAAGSFQLNGVTIAYTTTDSVNSIISRINASTAGVRASYDASTDKISLTNNDTGNKLITIGGDTGTLLSALNLTTPTQTPGSNALYSLDNGVTTRSSASNTVTDAVAGVTLNLKSTSASQVTVTVAQDTGTTLQAVQSFVSAYNKVLDTIDKYSAYDAEKKQASLLTGDVTLMGMDRSLRSLVTSAATGLSSTAKYRSLADIGVSTGKIGSAVGTTTRLQLDAAKLTTALTDNPQAVETMVAGLLSSASGLAGSGRISAMTGHPTGAYESGTYTVKMTDGLGAAELWFQPTGGTNNKLRDMTLAVGDNTTILPGMTFTIASVAAGQDTFNVSVDQRGVMQWLKYNVDKALAPDNGIFAAREDGAVDEARRLDQDIAAMQTRLDEKEKALNAKFAALEVALAKMQSQSSSLSNALAGLSKSG